MAVTVSLHEALQNAIISPCMLMLISGAVLVFDDVIHTTVMLVAFGMQTVSMDTCIDQNNNQKDVRFCYTQNNSIIIAI